MCYAKVICFNFSLQLPKHLDLGFHGETLFFQLENFGILIQGKYAPSLGELLEGFIFTIILQKVGDIIT
jgi:hypothetical protein